MYSVPIVVMKITCDDGCLDYAAHSFRCSSFRKNNSDDAINYLRKLLQAQTHEILFVESSATPFEQHIVEYYTSYFPELTNRVELYDRRTLIVERDPSSDF